jgi:spore coat protein U-like protein
MQLSVSAIITSASNCRFTTGSASMGFGNLDPANPVDVPKTSAFTFRCDGGDHQVVFAVTQNGGLHPAGPGTNRMQHTSTADEFLPYSLALSSPPVPIPRNTGQTLTVSGTVRGVDYQSARVGTYSDTVTITINP